MTTKRHVRTHARWCAIQALYAAEVQGIHPAGAVVDGCCLYTGDVLDELESAIAEAVAAWEPLYEQWQQQLEQGDEYAKKPVLADIDMSVHAGVAPLPDYALMLVEGVDENLAAIDERLGAVSSNWSVERMPVADRCILRLAAYEMFCVDETPISVSINEAVDLAKFFGGQNESSQFVNGVLGNIARGIEAGEVLEPPVSAAIVEADATDGAESEAEADAPEAETLREAAEDEAVAEVESEPEPAREAEEGTAHGE
ncbi:transcription antitermination factor NusB [Adlercreutzia sp. ZJ138]|uniref:transcription antitermination factor NusB n=1 Tax=Adlercreutzia sp. ZJ138 TaxID=2709405 RepID=UPI0013EA033C|nr:transcription antitermination factor NusB [Adlercreutzia sp. ZJ138]